MPRCQNLLSGSKTSTTSITPSDSQTFDVPFVFVAGGRKYIKVARRDNQTSVVCFVRAEDGAILKAASWKAPALNFTRGSIFNREALPFMCYGL